MGGCRVTKARAGFTVPKGHQSRLRFRAAAFSSIRPIQKGNLSMPKDKFETYNPAPSVPATQIIEITPDDATDLAWVTSALNVSTTDTVRVTTQSGTTSDVTISPGNAFPLRVTRVWATGTTATGIRGLI
jgi:hypothetical protein